MTEKRKLDIISKLSQQQGLRDRAKKLLEKYIVMRRTRGQNKTKI